MSIARNEASPSTKARGSPSLFVPFRLLGTGFLRGCATLASLGRRLIPASGNTGDSACSRCNKKRCFLVLLVAFFGFFLKKDPVVAQNRAFVSIVNPVRGKELWGQKDFEPSQGVEKEGVVIETLGLPATWLLRFDVITDSTLSSSFKKFLPNQEVGIFLEITPTLAKSAGVDYPQGGVFWHDANKIFLSGYQPEVRERLISNVFETFKNTFGYYPRSVGAWHVDAYSAQFMKEKYGITGVLICADQFGTDGYQIWGGWWGVPYYPSRLNILVPAQTLRNKLDLVVFQWAARDPELGYGGSVEESTYSVQVNDYQSQGLGLEYFRKLLDVYLKSENQFNQLTVGLENDADWEKIGLGYELQMKEIEERESLGEAKVVTMADFSSWYRSRFPRISPNHKIDDWKMSADFRVGFTEINNERYLRDLRFYNENWPEPYLLTANPWPTLSLNVPYEIDTVRFPEKLEKISPDYDPIKSGQEGLWWRISFGTKLPPLIVFWGFLLASLILSLKRNLKLLALILAGSITLSLPMIKSGLIYPFGMGFWGPNGHDGIWHLALIKKLSRFSLQNPVFSGAKLTNYHFGYDFLLAIVHRFTGISAINLYFQIIPPVLAILLGVFTYGFVEKWTKSKASAFLATFFVYFGGSWGWLVTLLRNKSLGGESLFWANQAVSSQINPPYMLSLVLIVAGLNILVDYWKRPTKRNLWVLGLIFGILLPIKVYSGVIVLGSLLGVLGIGRFFTKTKSEEIFKVFGLSLLISIILFLPFNLQAASLLIFFPLWFPRTMVAFQDRFYWPVLANARQAYLATNQWARWFLTEVLGLTIFIIGNLGTRVIGFIALAGWARRIKELTQIEYFLTFALGISGLFPLLFIQKGNPWNTIQFFYYFQFFLGILAGVILGRWAEKKSLVNPIFTWLVISTFILLTLPTSIFTLRNDYLPSRPPARISFEELEALGFLTKRQSGVVLSFPFEESWRQKFSEPRPLYAYETTGYISALSGQPSYLADEMNLEISGYNWKSRREEEFRFFQTNNQEWAKNFLRENGIKYLYLVKGQKLNLGEEDINAQKIFENGEVRIFEIKW
jgi:hypothetical protein